MPYAQLVKPGGVVVYATCTFAPEENEGVVDVVVQMGRLIVGEHLAPALVGAGGGILGAFRLPLLEAVAV